MSLQLRLKRFDMSFGPAMFFGIVVLPMIKVRLRELDRLQMKMMGRIVGWRRMDKED